MGNCCGNKRKQWSSGQLNHQKDFIPANPSTGNYSTPVNPPVKLKYIGDTKLVLVGTVSRRAYHFLTPQMILEVDGADARSLTTHPLVIQV